MESGHLMEGGRLIEVGLYTYFVVTKKNLGNQSLVGNTILITIVKRANCFVMIGYSL